MQLNSQPETEFAVKDATSPGALAKWQIFPADMEAFRIVDARRGGRLWSLKNSMKMPKNVALEGFPIVVERQSLVVGDRTYAHGLKEFGTAGEVALHEGEPGFIEISCILETGGKPVIVVLRLPVPASAREEAAKALVYFDSQIAPANRERIHRRFAAHFEAASAGTDEPHRLQQRRKWLIPALALFLIGLVVVIFLLILT